MDNPDSAIEFIFDSDIEFEKRCLRAYRYQADHNSIFERFISTFGLQSSDHPAPDEIPLLPVRGFKDAKIMVENDKSGPELKFRSSGTSDMNRSSHYVLSRRMYETAICTEFKKHFPFEEYSILFYLPGYNRNPHSSLIWMAKYLIGCDFSGKSRFISIGELSDPDATIKKNHKKTLLFGAAFGLIDMIESDLLISSNNLEIIETGGMKTHRREMSKSDLRGALSDGFEVPPEKIHSEYGMCELLSQMYAIGGEWFDTPHWVKVSIRDPENPMRICDAGEEGVVGIIDLANIYSCPFILTGDKGIMDDKGKFRVLGRWNTEDLRGCNFLIDNE